MKIPFPFHKISIILAAGSVILLTACGGGGGGGGSATPGGGSSGSTASTVTASNANDVAAVAYGVVTSLNGSADTAATILTGVSVAPSTQGGPNLLDTSLRQLYRAIGSKPASLPVGVTQITSSACSGGGSITLAYNVSNPSVVSAGDTLTISANNCVESGETLNGSLSYRFNSVTGTIDSASTWSASMTITYNHTSITVGTVTEAVNGDLTLSYSQDATGAVSFNTSGTSLQTTITRSSGTSSSTLSNYSYGGSISAAGVYTFYDNFTFSGTYSRLGTVGYKVETLTNFQEQPSDHYPSVGAMKVAASDRTSVTLTVLSNTSVRLDIDSNGDGITDSSNTMTWTQFASL